MVKMVVKKSDKTNKKLMAIFTKDNGRTKTVHFGQAGADDYTIKKDKEQRKRYRDRHQKDLNTKDPMKAGYLSYFILWGESTSRAENIKAYKKRFNFS
tara:strand:- start:580 stop:873 length:294 start_codon:yes stop_codon:yes gene_type:complete